MKIKHLRNKLKMLYFTKTLYISKKENDNGMV